MFENDKHTCILRDKDDGDISAIMSILDYNTGFVDFKLYDVCGWTEGEQFPVSVKFVAKGIIKWDGCSHWNFTGEDDDNSSYYHLCGSERYVAHIIDIIFAEKVAEKILNSDELDSEFASNTIFDMFVSIFNAKYSIVDVEPKTDTWLQAVSMDNI